MLHSGDLYFNKPRHPGFLLKVLRELFSTPEISEPNRGSFSRSQRTPFFNGTSAHYQTPFLLQEMKQIRWKIRYMQSISTPHVY